MKIKEWVLKNKMISALFLISAAFFIWQHSTGISWDFSAYVLNAKFWLAQSQYFEWTRPPLVQTVLLPLSLFGWPIAEYVYIIFVSLVFLLSAIKFSKTFGVNEKVFYMLVLGSFVLAKAFFGGAELLSLSLLIMAFSYSKEKKLLGFFFFGLAFLARYSNIVFIIPLLLRRDLKFSFIGLVVFFLTLVPWIAFNYFSTGDPLTAFLDHYGSLISARGYIEPNFPLSHALASFNILIPFFLVSIFRKIKKKSFRVEDLLMLSILIINLIIYYQIPIKDIRYLMPAVFPIAYFSSLVINERKALMILLAGLVFLIIAMQIYESEILLPPAQRFSASLSELDKCGLKSNAWIYMNYLNRTTEQPPFASDVNYSLEIGYRVLLFKGIAEPDYVNNKTFISQFPIIKENENFIILGDKDRCTPIIPVDSTYLERLSNYTQRHFNYKVESNACKIFLPWICGGSRI